MLPNDLKDLISSIPSHYGLFIILLLFSYYSMQPAVPSGVLLQIICKASNLALSIQNSQNPHNSRVVGVASNPQQLCQLWYISSIPGGFEIINSVSDLGFEEYSGEIHLRKQKRKREQLYVIQQVRKEKDSYYMFRNTVKSSYVASLQGILKSKQLNEDDDSQLFRLQPVTNNQIINLTTIILHPSMDWAIDVPESKKEPGLKLILFQRHGRFNQRWVFVQVFNNYMIKNFKTGLVLDLKSDPLKYHIIQSKRTNSLTEIWIVEQQADGFYHIRSLNKPEYYLIAEDSRLTIGKNAFRWRLEGFQP